MRRRIRWGPLVLVGLVLLHAVAAVAVAASEADDRPAGLIAVAVVVGVAAFLVLVGPALALRARAAAEAATPPELAEPPSDLPPALVALLVGHRGRGRRAAVAATVLQLAERGQLRIDPLDAERFELTVVPDARGELPFEWYVLQNLRGGASEAQGRTVTGPPLWRPEMWRRPRLGTFERDVLQVAANRQLLTPVASAAVLFVLPMALAACMLALESGQAVAVLSWGFGPGAFVGLFAGVVLGHRRTPAGELEAARWLAHGRWLRRTANLDDVGVPAFLVWGHHLTNGVATGVAGTAADALSP